MQGLPADPAGAAAHARRSGAVLSGLLLVCAPGRPSAAGWNKLTAALSCAITSTLSRGPCAIPAKTGLVLDVGCGGGLFLRMMRELGFPGLGLETSPRGRQAGLGAKRVAVVCGDLAHSPVVNESCAAVTMFHVLEHLHDPVAYLHSARALLRPNGRLIVQIPNASSWQFLMFGEYWNGVDVPRHLINYRQKDLENLLEYCGFRSAAAQAVLAAG